ncbi:MAG: xanthine dehydrogenase family protein molybdopterin-binding subunit [Burkholderia sp.]|nr:xanthine dehydrogenase family protein molybdopterin-binding subunit [Burkholderia sp.]
MISEISRRSVLRAGVAIGGGLLLEMRLPEFAYGSERLVDGGEFSPNAFIRIDGRGAISFIMRSVEMGQGIYTAAAMLIAEELEVRLDQIEALAAPANEALYTDPILGQQETGGSASTRSSWIPLRQAGATARVMLIMAAAKRCGVVFEDCVARQGMVTHSASGRSASYGELAEDAARQPVPDNVPLKPASEFRLIGSSAHRLDSAAKANGTATFGIDIKVPGMKIGTVAACPVRGGRLVSIDEAAAKRVSGVRDVVRLDDLVSVIGDNMWAATQGLAAANPHWDEGPNKSVSTEDLIKDLDTASRQPGVVAKQEGDPVSAIAGSVTRIDAVYQLPFLAHAPMEPINTTIHIRADGADVWVGTQVPVRAQLAVALVTGLPQESINIHNQYLGGGFGRRLDVDSIHQAARIAKQLPYPVKLIWTREEDIQHDLYRPYYYDRVSAGLDAQGNISGWTHRVTGSSVAARWRPSRMQKDGHLDPDAVLGATETPYELPATLVDYVRCEPRVFDTLWWRGVGQTHNVFVVESLMDELAAAASQDPVDFRRKFLKKNSRGRSVLDLAVEKSGWGKPLPKGWGRGVALQFSFNTHVASVLEAEISGGEIRLRRVHIAVDCGPVVNPNIIEAQMEGGMIFGLTMALYGEITVTNGRVDQSNFNDYRMLRMNQAPEISVHLVNNPDAPIGGIGETGTVAAAPALANAIYSATGRRLRRIPFAQQVAQTQ